MEADKDRDGKISFEEFTKMVENTDVSMSMTLGMATLALLYFANSSICYSLPTNLIGYRSVLEDGKYQMPHSISVD